MYVVIDMGATPSTSGFNRLPGGHSVKACAWLHWRPAGISRLRIAGAMQDGLGVRPGHHDVTEEWPPSRGDGVDCVADQVVPRLGGVDRHAAVALLYHHLLELCEREV